MSGEHGSVVAKGWLVLPSPPPPFATVLLTYSGHALLRERGARAQRGRGEGNCGRPAGRPYGCRLPPWAGGGSAPSPVRGQGRVGGNCGRPAGRPYERAGWGPCPMRPLRTTSASVSGYHSLSCLPGGIRCGRASRRRRARRGSRSHPPVRQGSRHRRRGQARRDPRGSHTNSYR